MGNERTFENYVADQITELNSKGIQLLKEGEFAHGAEIFLEAMTLLLLSEVKGDDISPATEYLAIDVLAEETTDGENHVSCSSYKQGCYSRQRRKATEKGRIYSVAIPNCNKTASTLSNDVYQFFDRAIGAETMGLPSSYEDKLLIIGVLSYNIGLAYHLGGVYLCKSSLLTSALEYYNMAFKILDDMLSSQTTASAVGRMTKLPLLAALNNIGHIHAYHCSYSCAEEYCEEIAYHLESIGCLQLNAVASEEETDIFIQNACFYPRSEEISAAAA
ncbi:hypothetical protein FisN_10Hu146 [Fistulifera solaris]|jgi:hypothetical protein|uniref:KIF-binding protein n=1 Tax=Fistulifera solaris TaxID=1519565 RepID=A0A1Z5JX76_FISSO|nr:hypothetical protein FisN_10Hu146 [Fistulifera solaris]|eukprot:GAX18643.1 hypothetical protein FisN_10Hu146 [Fistulifera solaris]